jgi:hypothetical protein
MSSGPLLAGLFSAPEQNRHFLRLFIEAGTPRRLPVPFGNIKRLGRYEQIENA